MIVALEHKTDTLFVSEIDQKNAFQWNNLFDLYAPLMYGSILRLISNRKHAENILLEAFMMLKENRLCAQLRKPLSVGLLFHTHKVALNYLRSKNLKLKSNTEFYQQFPLLKNISSQNESTDLVAQMENIQELNIPVKLKNQINLLSTAPPRQLAIPTTSLSKFYFFVKKLY